MIPHSHVLVPLPEHRWLYCDTCPAVAHAPDCDGGSSCWCGLSAEATVVPVAS